METLHTLEEQTIMGIKDLVEINTDSAEGFRAAAGKVESTELTQFFLDCATNREKNANALRSYLAANDEDFKPDGTVLGTVHRWWLELRGTVQSGDEHAMLAEAEQGEDAIKARYEKVLKETAGNPLNDVLLKQYATVKSMHDTVRDMRDARA